MYALVGRVLHPLVTVTDRGGTRRVAHMWHADRCEKVVASPIARSRYWLRRGVSVLA